MVGFERPHFLREKDCAAATAVAQFLERPPSGALTRTPIPGCDRGAQGVGVREPCRTDHGRDFLAIGGAASMQQRTVGCQGDEAVQGGPAIGRFYDVEGRRLLLRHSGTGAPAVVFVPGAGLVGLDYLNIHNLIAPLTTSVLYDRAGTGWSDQVKLPRTASVIADALRRLLLAAGVPPPYVLVGHALGGMYVRRYAQRFPDEVAGLLFLDPAAHEDDPGHMPKQKLLTKLHQALALLRLLLHFKRFYRREFERMFATWPDAIREPLIESHLRSLQKEFHEWPAHSRSLKGELFDEIREAGKTPDVPLIVLSAMGLDPSPRSYRGVTISSTFTDLKEHRTALIAAIRAHGLTDVAMENDSAKLMDVVGTSLQMVRDGSAYIGVISKKYGQIPACPRRNSDGVSITELEFNEALRLGRPILQFVMGDEHYVREKDIELVPDYRAKLDAFRAKAKKISAESFVHRVYASFNSLEEFKERIGPSIADLRRQLDALSEPFGTTVAATKMYADHDPIPKPPAFYAEPAYIGSHKFVGRQAQLDALSDWAQPADLHTVLLFEAIGGNGKSMLTWEWTTQHATKVRTDWAGRFWYSFYEKGALMADFCQRALAYITSQPLENYRKKKTQELSELLLHHLRARPWLFVLDGLERVLVAYHRIDAAEVPDEEANQPTDKIVGRDPCAAIRPEDDDLLRALASAAPSKVLVSSRLVPRVLLNPAGQAIPGVQRISLPGLRPTDAEALLRSCGVTGEAQAIQSYLTSNCDCHPLVIGILAGLITDYVPDRGNFDAWAADPEGGGQLNLANLDLIQKRNHILRTGLDALPEKSRQLLSTLALLSESVDYATLSALNPHRPPEPAEVDEPEKPDRSWRWKYMSDAEKSEAQEEYELALQRRKEYEQAVEARPRSAVFRAAQGELARTVHDLERRGLLQYDGRVKRYDLHPVVRGVAAGRLPAEERDEYGQRVVDHFSRRAHNPYEQAEALEDIRDGLNVVRTLLKMGRFKQACDA
jgi:pimeloyl-ACP methyl ester carboxylesterase